MITVHDVTLRFGARVLMQNVSFRVDKGDKVGLVGRNGAGKTTLTRMLSGDGQPAEGSITSIFIERDGVLLTPPLSCGLLPGVLRAELLASGRAVEQVLTLADLAAAEAIWLGNSVRGLIRAQWVKEPA